MACNQAKGRVKDGPGFTAKKVNEIVASGNPSMPEECPSCNTFRVYTDFDHIIVFQNYFSEADCTGLVYSDSILASTIGATTSLITREKSGILDFWSPF